MDRFIAGEEKKADFFNINLKSSMDRFIDVQYILIPEEHKEFKIQYG